MIVFDTGVTIEYSETESGTLLANRAAYEFGDSLLDRILEPVAKRYNARQFRNMMQTTKELIEAEASAETTAGVQ